MVAANLDQRLSSAVGLQATAYARNLSRGTVNGDEAEFELCPDPDGGEDLLCEEGGALLRSETRLPIATAEAYDAIYNTTRTATLGYGATLQVSVEEPLWSRANQFVAGATYDGAHVAFLQRAELGRLTEQRTLEGAGIFVAGDAFRTDLEAEERNLGLYASDTFTPVEPLAITAAARFNLANIEIDDRLGAALEGDHTYSRINPSLGLTYTPLPLLTLFASYSEATRAPSAAELSCADPEEPCRVPNAFVSDPPLDQVVSRSIELGLRGTLGGTPQRPAFGWSIAGFGSRNADDIIFVAAQRVGTGYFRNAGDTQRIGLELAARGEFGPVQFYASYTLLRATFESELELPGAAHPEAVTPEEEEEEEAEAGEEDEDDEGGVIQVQKGDRIPGLPTHVGKAGVTVTPIERLELTLQGVAQSSQFLRGDEVNLLDSLDGYVILGARVTYHVLDELAIFVKGENLLDTEYETFGVVADPSEVLPDASVPRFVSPGAPLAFWAGVTLTGF
jgi:outer membrane receptor protein involved in Fe transport